MNILSLYLYFSHKKYMSDFLFYYCYLVSKVVETSYSHYQ